MFVNETAFRKPQARLQALGQDTRVAALVNLQGQTLAHPQTGGMISPTRHTINSGTILYRFASGRNTMEEAVAGGWWIGEKEFDKICGFARHHDVHAAMGARMLCCVPPEWSNMGLLVKVRVNSPILAFRGLGNNVSVKHEDGGKVNMKANNQIPARRLHQLYIPGLVEYAGRTPEQVLPGAMSHVGHWRISERQANAGWIYI